MCLLELWEEVCDSSRRVEEAMGELKMDKPSVYGACTMFEYAEHVSYYTATLVRKSAEQ